MTNKVKKKRNKQYTGIDAAITKPVVTHISAANRSKPSQWWFDHKRIARPVLIAVVIVVVLVWLTIELIRIANQ